MNQQSSKECPKCRLINPSTALRCDCGYDFESGVLPEEFQVKRPTVSVIFQKVLALFGLVIVWSLAIVVTQNLTVELGAIPMMLVSLPFLYGFWLIYKLEGGKEASFIFAGAFFVLILGVVLFT